MKSLESLEIINNCLEELDYEHKEDTNIWRYDLEVIKQDLEVLEILRKYLSSKEYIVETYQGDRTEKTIEMQVIEENGKFVDYRKLKQWLEENENDR